MVDLNRVIFGFLYSDTEQFDTDLDETARTLDLQKLIQIGKTRV